MPRRSRSYTGARSQGAPAPRSGSCRAAAPVQAGGSGVACAAQSCDRRDAAGRPSAVSPLRPVRRAPPARSGRGSPRRVRPGFSAAARRSRVSPATASMTRIFGSPTRKRRAGPAATDAFIDRETLLPKGVRTSENAVIACCMPRAQAAACSPLSPSNQQVTASPAKEMALPPHLCSSFDQSVVDEVQIAGQLFRAALRPQLAHERLRERGEAGDVGEERSAVCSVGQVTARGHGVAPVHGNIGEQVFLHTASFTALHIKGQRRQSPQTTPRASTMMWKTWSIHISISSYMGADGGIRLKVFVHHCTGTRVSISRCVTPDAQRKIPGEDQQQQGGMHAAVHPGGGMAQVRLVAGHPVGLQRPVRNEMDDDGPDQHFSWQRHSGFRPYACASSCRTQRRNAEVL